MTPTHHKWRTISDHFMCARLGATFGRCGPAPTDAGGSGGRCDVGSCASGFLKSHYLVEVSRNECSLVKCAHFECAPQSKSCLQLARQSQCAPAPDRHAKQGRLCLCACGCCCSGAAVRPATLIAIGRSSPQSARGRGRSCVSPKRGRCAGGAARKRRRDLLH